MTKADAFEPRDMHQFEPDAKVGLLATVTPENRVHVTLITTLCAKTPGEMMFGQFSEGQSKQNVRTNPRVGFLLLTMDRKMWRGAARWTRCETEGPDYDAFNQRPMFRYNAYFGIHTVHFLDLVHTYGRESLPLAKIAAGMAAARAGALRARRKIAPKALTPWARKLFNNPAAPKFLAHLGPDGYPHIIPLLTCAAADTGRLVFSPLGYESELARLKPGDNVAVYGLTFSMENTLTRGRFFGFSGLTHAGTGRVDIDYAYNSMPPVPGQTWPPVPLEAVG